MSGPEWAGVTGAGKGYDDERPNVDLAYRVFQLSLDEGVERVVVASSNHAADWYEPLLRDGRLEMLYPDSYPLSDNYYGWAKIAYEALGFLFAASGGGPLSRSRRRLGNVHLRVGAPREPHERGATRDANGFRRYLATYISQRDLQQLFCKSIEAPSIDDEWGVPFQIFYGISGNARAFWSIANARRVIGYAPEDDSETKFHDDVRRVLVAWGEGRHEQLRREAADDAQRRRA